MGVSSSKIQSTTFPYRSEEVKLCICNSDVNGLTKIMKSDWYCTLNILEGHLITAAQVADSEMIYYIVHQLFIYNRQPYVWYQVDKMSQTEASRIINCIATRMKWVEINDKYLKMANLPVPEYPIVRPEEIRRKQNQKIEEELHKFVKSINESLKHGVFDCKPYSFINDINQEHLNPIIEHFKDLGYKDVFIEKVDSGHAKWSMKLPSTKVETNPVSVYPQIHPNELIEKMEQRTKNEITSIIKNINSNLNELKFKGLVHPCVTFQKQHIAQIKKHYQSLGFKDVELIHNNQTIEWSMKLPETKPDAYADPPPEYSA